MCKKTCCWAWESGIETEQEDSRDAAFGRLLRGDGSPRRLLLRRCRAVKDGMAVTSQQGSCRSVGYS